MTVTECHVSASGFGSDCDQVLALVQLKPDAVVCNSEPGEQLTLCRRHLTEAAESGYVGGVIKFAAGVTPAQLDQFRDTYRSLLQRVEDAEQVTRLQLVVTYHDHVIMYYPLTADGGWKVDPSWRQIIIGRGVPRTFIPLDAVRSYSIEQVGGDSS